MTQKIAVNSWIKENKNENFEMSTTNSNTITKVWNEYVESSTVHCISRVWKSTSSKIRRGIWCVIFLGLMGFVVYTVYYQASRYLNYSTISKQYQILVPEPEFPAVTICNLNRIAKSAGLDNATVELLLQTYKTIPVNMTYFNNLNETFLNSINLREMFQDFSASLNKSFIFCSFHGVIISCTSFFRKTITDYGVCASLDIDLLKEHGHLSQSFSTFGNSHGLTVRLSANQDDYLIGEAAAGFLVLAHDADDVPAMVEEGLAISPGYSARLAVQKKKYIYLPHPAIAFNDRECINTKASNFVNHLTDYKQYSYPGCVSECESRFIAETCGCKGALMPGNYRVCNPKEVVTCQKQAVATFAKGSRGMCDCLIPCEYEMFEQTLSQAWFPRAGTIDLNGVTVPVTEDLRSDILELKVYYKSRLVTIMEQTLELTGTDVIASIGGFLGLFIGASMGSIVEIMELVINIIIVKMKGR